MPEIRLVKKYPHIKDEDVTSIFQEGYIKGFENGRKGAIPIEQIKKKLLSGQYEYENDYDIGFDKGWNCALRALLRDWEKENADNN